MTDCSVGFAVNKGNSLGAYRAVTLKATGLPLSKCNQHVIIVLVWQGKVLAKLSLGKLKVESKFVYKAERISNESRTETRIDGHLKES